MNSIRADGQDTPILLRPNPDRKTVDAYPFALVAGFKRFEAMTRITEHAMATKEYNPIVAEPHWDARKATIKATIKEMTEAQARAANIRENTARDNLTLVDLTFGLRELVTAYTKEKQSAKGAKTAIAAELGMNKGYIGYLIDIGQGFSEEVLTHWRTSQKRLTKEQMVKVLTESTAERRTEAYHNMCKSGTVDGPTTDQSGNQGAAPDAKLVAAVQKLQQIGRYFAYAEAHDQLPEGTCAKMSLEGFMVDGGVKEPGLVKFKKNPKGSELKKLRKGFAEGVEAGFKAVLDADKAAQAAAEEEEEDTAGVN